MRTIGVAPDRLPRWITGFSERHGAPRVSGDGRTVVLAAPDGAEATVQVPFPPLQDDHPVVETLLDHVQTPRQVGAILVRKGGFAVGVFAGRRLIDSKVGTAYVQARTKAGGWSQHRYARRRDNQAQTLFGAAADAAALVLLPRARDLDAVVSGGDHAAVTAVLADPRLAPLRALHTGRTLPVPDPRLVVLQAFPTQFLAVPIQLNDLA